MNRRAELNASVSVGWFLLSGLLGLLLVVRMWWADPSLAATGARPPRYQLELNQATSAELRALPNIGRRLAERIVRDRETHGPFAGPDQLSRVHGIGPATVEQLRPYLRCEAP